MSGGNPRIYFFFLCVSPFPHAHFCISWLSTFSSKASHPSPGQAQKQAKKVWCEFLIWRSQTPRRREGAPDRASQSPTRIEHFCVVLGSRNPRTWVPPSTYLPTYSTVVALQLNGENMRRFVGFALAIPGAGNLLTFAAFA
jgi:hypothetical protein